MRQKPKAKRAPRARRHSRRHHGQIGIWSTTCRDCKMKFRVVYGPKPKFCVRCKSKKLDIKPGRLSPQEKAAQDSAFMFAAGRMVSFIMDLFGIPRPDFAPPPPPFQPRPPAMSREEAAAFIAKHAGYSAEWRDHSMFDEELREAAYRIAAKKLHPDAGGSHELFVKLQQAKEALA